MAEITNETLPWFDTDEVNWNAFLQTITGQRLLPKLAEQAPQLLDGKDVNQTLVRNGELRGFQLAIQTLLSMTHSPPRQPETSPAYPPPEDDRHWEGEKLNPETPKQ